MQQSLNFSKGVRYTKTKDRSMVARLNKACESVHYFEDLLDYNSISQPYISKMASRRLIGIIPFVLEERALRLLKTSEAATVLKSFWK